MGYLEIVRLQVADIERAVRYWNSGQHVGDLCRYLALRTCHQRQDACNLINSERK